MTDWVPPERELYYLPAGDEIAIFQQCHSRGLSVMLKGPTGCGKTRFVETHGLAAEAPAGDDFVP